ncbi:hypothetical protein R9X47_11255 [Wukongibacter baidiensis]|uniref:hypothetical protein n=1 Tax=Wukongibacter baidiensis TaxID=1723361 RepID=UPI003D7F94CC
MFKQSNIRVDFTKADYTDINFSDKDKQILKELAKEVTEIASRPIMEERKRLWTNHNKLKRTRPLILCDPENGWNEIIREEDIKCQNSIARHWEYHLRKQIFWGNEMNDDYVVEHYFDVPHVYEKRSWGVGDSSIGGDSYRDDGGAYHIDTLLEDYDKINTIVKPQINIDYETTDKVLDIAHEVFDEILDVRLRTIWFWSVGLTDEFAFLRGMEKLMFDFYDYPEKVHELMELLMKGTLEKLDFLEKNNLFSLNNDSTYVGSGGVGFSDELPGKDFNGNVCTRNMWGLAESQITVGVAPDMFEEFIFPYQKKMMERFALSCYGCCEPMDQRFDIVKTVSNLRRVSVSPWANKEIMSEKLKGEYIYSLKPSPSPLALSKLNEDIVRNEIRDALNKTKNNCVEIIMKDNHTLGNNPDNLTRWVQIAREEIGRV